MGLPWYRVHTVVLNDPGRLIAVHLMHTCGFIKYFSILRDYVSIKMNYKMWYSNIFYFLI